MEEEEQVNDQENAPEGGKPSQGEIDRKGKERAVEIEESADDLAWQRYLVGGEGTSAQGAEAARATAEAVKAMAEASKAVA